MKLLASTGRVVAALLLFALFSTQAYAQATRTWVSGVGDDANPCSRTAPCKTFAGAISKTAAAGVISVLDPGGFGAVTITKSITIETDGQLAGVLSAGTNGVIVNAGVNDNVVLRGLSIDGAGTGLNGIRYLAGKSLTVERCVINGVTQKGIDFSPTGASTLTVVDSDIHGAANAVNGGAISVTPAVGGSANAIVEKSRLTRNLFGVKAAAPSKVTVRDTMIGNNDLFGVQATGNGAVMFVDNSVLTNNPGAAVGAVSSGQITLSRTAIFGNGTGLTAIGGQIFTFGDNRNAGNTTPGAPTAAPTATQ